MIPTMNEKQYVEEIINSSKIPEKTQVNTVIDCLTKYYYPQYDNVEDITTAVCQQMIKFNLDVRDYQEYKCKLRVKRLCNAIANQKLALLREYDFIPLYKSEKEKIMSCENDKEKKFLFTLYILARYTNRYGWVYNPKNEIFKLANVSSTREGYKEIIYNLLQRGLIKNTKKVDDTKIGVELADTSEEIVFEVKKMQSLGNQFMAAFVKDGYIVCDECGKLVKIYNDKDFSTKRCDKCKNEVRKENRIEYNKKYYEKSKENSL